MNLSCLLYRFVGWAADIPYSIEHILSRGEVWQQDNQPNLSTCFQIPAVAFANSLLYSLNKNSTLAWVTRWEFSTISLTKKCFPVLRPQPSPKLFGHFHLSAVCVVDLSLVFATGTGKNPHFFATQNQSLHVTTSKWYNLCSIRHSVRSYSNNYLRPTHIISISLCVYLSFLGHLLHCTDLLPPYNFA